jgi:hypothetical protein
MEETMKKAIVVLAIVIGIIVNYSIKARAQMGFSMMGNSGTAWGTGSFRSNGERIYFTATSERDAEISYTNGPESNDWILSKGLVTEPRASARLLILYLLQFV